MNNCQNRDFPDWWMIRIKEGVYVMKNKIDDELKQSLNFVHEKEIPIYCEGITVGTRRMDFLVEGQVMKALTKLEDVHLAQGLNYLTAYQ